MRILAAAAMMLLLASPVHAAPPPPSLCPGLTGDALTRCLYSDLDDRIEGTTPPPTTPPPQTGNWLSGAAGREAADGRFGTWRGTPVEIATFWVNDPALYPIGPAISGCGDCGMWRNFAGPVSISASPSNWQGWAAEANGANDTFWTQVARNARELRAGKGQVYLNPYYEFNGDWMPYSVARTTQGQADFVKAFERTAAILRREFPGVKVVINPAAGRTVPTAMWPATGAFDVVGIDTYNEWPHCAVASCQGTQITRIEVLRLQAAARGKPIAFPEWGNAAVAGQPGGGGESPAFIDAFYGYLGEHAGTGAGQVVYETYFNIGGYAQRFELYPSTVQPQTAARYVQKF